MQQATLCFLLKGNEVLLGMKKRGFGIGKWNGFGGKVHEGESIENCVIRETREESGVHLVEFEKVGEIEFFFPAKREWEMAVQVFRSRTWNGEERETEEMMPMWFDKACLPFEQMWADDREWLPRVLNGERIVAKFVFEADNETIKEFEIKQES